MGLFRRKRRGPATPEEMLAQGREGPQPIAGGVASADFRFEVAEVFTITGRGVVVTGTISTGSVAVDSVVEVRRDDFMIMTCRVGGIEASRKMYTQASSGEAVSLLLADAVRRDLRAGDILQGAR